VYDELVLIDQSQLGQRLRELDASGEDSFAASMARPKSRASARSRFLTA